MKQEQNSQQTSAKQPATPYKATVLRLLKMDELEYNWMQLKQGLAYLRAYLNGDEYGIAMLESSRIFWCWWRDHWNKRDEKFLLIHSRVPGLQKPEYLRQLYAQYHNGSMLSKNIHPNSVVINESYIQMTHKIVKTETATV